MPGTSGQKEQNGEDGWVDDGPEDQFEVEHLAAAVALELKPDLRLQTAIVGVLGKSFAIESAGHLIREAE